MNALRKSPSGKLQEIFPAPYATVLDLRSVKPEPGDVYYTSGQESAGDGFEGTWIGLPLAEPGTYVHDGLTTVVPLNGDGSIALGRVEEPTATSLK